MFIDINCDLGEGMLQDQEIMPYISSANIACGYHAGDEAMIALTIERCKKYKVFVGAHPSFPDRENFGRIVIPYTEKNIYTWVYDQLTAFGKICETLGVPLHHIKPHGALYNLAADDEAVAMAIVKAVYDFDKQLIVYALYGGKLQSSAIEYGLRCYAEAFADRTYTKTGRLTSRNQSNALIHEETQMIEHVHHMLLHHQIKTMEGDTIPVDVNTICLHGDGPHALLFARALWEYLTAHGLVIRKS